MSEKKSISSINEKIGVGKAVVLTDIELKEIILGGREPGMADVDVVTISWHASMQGTAAMLCVPVAERGVFTRAKKIWLNGVPGLPGPAPNERLGVVDTLIFAGQSVSDKQNAYNGARLFFDLLNKKEIQVECLSEEGGNFKSTFTVDKLLFARMYVYNCFFNGLPKADAVGQYNPNRHFETIGPGSKVLLNKARGIVIGDGTRSSPERRSLSLAADMFDMDPDTMVSSENSSEPVIRNSIALPIPILNEGILMDLSAWLMERNLERSGDVLRVPETEMARFLKELIVRGDFLLTKSAEVEPSALELEHLR